ncbi:hypothetical protein B7W85_09380 [Allorhizobium ampelinum]|nr:hypothetical protein B7W85_09380 [Allorhizobium ampelinum]
MMTDVNLSRITECIPRLKNLKLRKAEIMIFCSLPQEEKWDGNVLLPLLPTFRLDNNDRQISADGLGQNRNDTCTQSRNVPSGI